MTAHYYNEFNPDSAAMLQQFMDDGLIPYGEIDTRSIADVTPKDLTGFTQCHFFAGIAGWQFALQLAGWSEDRPVWTGSCPCQPFSAAGRQKGKADDRHLWPVWLGLIEECRPPTIFGEQVSNAIGGETKGLSDLFQRTGTIELLLEEVQRQGVLSTRLQVLRDKEESTAQTQHDRAEPFDSDEMAREIQRLHSLLRSEEACKRSGAAIQPNTRVGSKENRCRGVRIDRGTIESHRREDLGQPLYRSDCTKEGVHEVELSNSSLFSECDDAQLGCQQDNRDSTIDYRGAEETLRRFAEQARTEFKEKAPPGWLDDVYEGLEAQGYAVGSAVLPASSVGAPHKRDRLWFVGNANSQRSLKREQTTKASRHRSPINSTGSTMGDSQQYGQHGCQISGGVATRKDQGRVQQPERPSASNLVVNANSEGLQGHRRSEQRDGQEGREVTKRYSWSSGVWIDCPDTKQRLVEPSIPLLAHGVQHRKPILHALGNAIVPQVAAEFINAFMETEMERQELKQSINEGVK